MTTRRELHAVATIISEALIFNGTLERLGVITNAEKVERDLAAAHIKNALADYYASINPLFSRQHFEDVAYKGYKERAQ